MEYKMNNINGSLKKNHADVRMQLVFLEQTIAF